MATGGFLEGRDLRVLIADSDRTVLELIQIRLDLAGYRAHVVRSGPAFLEAVKHVRPHAVVIELGLPEMDGFGVLESLNPRRQGLPFPTLVMGRKLSAEDVRKAVGLGARDCIAKPFSGAIILDRVAHLLRAHAPSTRSPAKIAFV